MEKWKNRIGLVVTIGFCAFFLTGFSSLDAKAFEWPKNFHIGTSGVGTNNYVIASIWGAALEKNSGMKVRVVPENDSGRILATVDGEIECIFFDSSEMDAYYRGLGAFADLPKANFYTLWFEKDVSQSFAVAADSPFHTFADFREYVENGNKIKVGHFAPAVGWSKRALGGFAAFAGIDISDIEPVPFGSIRNMYFSIPEKTADVIQMGPTSGAVPELMATPAGMRFLDMAVDDTAAWNRFLEVMNTDMAAQKLEWAPTKSLAGLGVTVSPAIWTVLDTLDEKLVYNIAKYLHQGYAEYSQASVQMERMNLPIFRKYLDIASLPVHPGTVRYLKEIGQWTAEDDIWNTKAMKTMQNYVDTWQKAAAMAEQKKIAIEIDNKDWEKLWADMIKDLPIFKTRF